ncbi:MAG: hypothetical protein WCI71_08145, partial [Bacteroidota bacterium]
MARVTGGLFDKMSGMLANQVYYRVINGKTYVSAKPKKRKKVERGKLPEGNKKFIKASHYATKAMIKPERKAIYQSVAGGLTTAYSMAIADFMKAPEIGTVSTREYRG